MLMAVSQPLPSALEFSFCAYHAGHQATWDRLVQCARNGAFMFQRAYMDYHADRFMDASLMIHRGRELVAVLPAHRHESQPGPSLVTHGGLTFGGVVLAPNMGAQDTIELMQALIQHLRQQGWTQLIYKPMPHVFQRQPSEADVHALIQMGAHCIRSDLAHTLDLARRPPLSKGRRHALGKARKQGLVVKPIEDLGALWPIIQGVLQARHQASPTHTECEMTHLRAQCPQIECLGAYVSMDEDSPLLAGAVSYRFDHVLHTQYLAATEVGRQCGALDAVIMALIDQASVDCRWLSFGASTQDQGRTLNAGLAQQKESFGAGVTLLQTYALDLEPV